MKCLICGNETENGYVCDSCKPKVTEELCYKVAGYNYKEPDNDLWAEIIDQLEKPFSFREISLDLIEYLRDDRKTFAKIQCLNLMNSRSLGVHKMYRDYVILHEPECINNPNLTAEEQNLVEALLLGCYVSNYSWDLIGDIPKNINTDRVFIESSLILADYYMKTTDYTSALEVLQRAKDYFLSEKDQTRINETITDYLDRESGKKKAWKPNKKEDIEIFNKYLDTLGVAHTSPANDKKAKIYEADFKPFVRYERSDLPDRYVALWITTEFYIKVDEAVEVSALLVKGGSIVKRFHSYVKPVNRPKQAKHVREEDYLNAPRIKEVYADLMDFIQNDILAIAGFDEQKKYLSRLARYSMFDHIDNEILDVIEYGEDISDDFTTYTRSTLLEKYGISEGNTGMEKAETTMKLVEAMR